MRKKTPERTCMACNLKTDKKSLARIVKTKNGEIFYDASGKTSGRGAYICKNIDCLEKVIKSNRLAKSLDGTLNETIYQQLREAVINE